MISLFKVRNPSIRPLTDILDFQWPGQLLAAGEKTGVVQRWLAHKKEIYMSRSYIILYDSDTHLSREHIIYLKISYSDI
jgi:hypothetical protein